MSEERKPWEQMIDKGEPDLWYGRFRAYLRLGTKRSIASVFQKTEKNREKQRLEVTGHWYEAAKTWGWESRARDYDEHQRAEEDRIIAEEREKVLRSGYALMHKRVKTLDRLSRKLEQIEKDESKVWLTETRTTTMGEGKSVVIEKTTFNHQLYILIDKYFDSIAKEVGDRVKKQELDVKSNDTTKSLHEAIEQALEQFPEARIVLAEKLAEVGKDLDQ